MNKHLKQLEWIARLSGKAPDAPTDERGLRDLLNRIVLDVRRVLREAEASDKSDRSDRSDKIIPAHGGYRRLKSFQVATLVYDGTCVFCDRFISKRSRTHDQMVQAARSGRQNIAEGSAASATSKKTEIKLTNVAKASLEELLLDYEDYLRQEQLRQWAKDAPEALAVRRRYRSYPHEWFEGGVLSDKSDSSELLDPYGTGATAEVAANTLICLINQAIYLLKRQIENQERAFLEEGGFTERMYAARRSRRGGNV